MFSAGPSLTPLLSQKPLPTLSSPTSLSVTSLETVQVSAGFDSLGLELHAIPPTRGPLQRMPPEADGGGVGSLNRLLAGKGELLQEEVDLVLSSSGD